MQPVEFRVRLHPLWILRRICQADPCPGAKLLLLYSITTVFFKITPSHFINTTCNHTCYLFIIHLPTRSLNLMKVSVSILLPCASRAGLCSSRRQAAPVVCKFTGNALECLSWPRAYAPLCKKGAKLLFFTMVYSRLTRVSSRLRLLISRSS